MRRTIPLIAAVCIPLSVTLAYGHFQQKKQPSNRFHRSLELSSVPPHDRQYGVVELRFKNSNYAKARVDYSLPFAQNMRPIVLTSECGSKGAFVVVKTENFTERGGQHGYDGFHVVAATLRRKKGNYTAQIAYAVIGRTDSTQAPSRPSKRKGKVDDSKADDDSPEYQLALLNEPDRFVPRDDPSVKRFGYLLDSLSAKFSLSKGDIGGKIYTAWEFVVDAGVRTTLLQAAQEINTEALAVLPGQVSFNDFVTTYVVLRRASP